MRIWVFAGLTATFFSCGGVESPTRETVYLPTVGDLKVSGRVVNRIDGVEVDGSRVEFSGIEAVTMWQRVHHGRYAIHGMGEGMFEVVVMSNENLRQKEHVEHKTARVEVTRDNLTFDFTLLVWGSQRFGAVYDQEFHGFFNELARVEGSRNAVWKWSILPTRIYVAREGISSGAFDEFLSLLEEVNQESIAAMFGDRTGPLGIESGPPINNSGMGTIEVRFHGGATSMDLLAVDGSITDARIHFSIETFDDAIGVASDRRAKKAAIAQELWRCAGATHATDPSSLMSQNSKGAVVTLSPKDKLAAWLMYHPDTRPGNRAPDTNPTYERP